MAARKKAKATAAAPRKSSRQTAAASRKGKGPQPQKSKKRLPESDDEGSDGEESQSEEEAPRPKKKKAKKSEPVEEVSDDEEDEMVEEVDDEGGDVEGDEGGDVEGVGEEEDRDKDVAVVKKDTTRDLLTIFSDRVKVQFIPKNGDKPEVLRGRWCTVCKASPKFLATHGKRKALHVGGNSSCRAHIRQHYELYKVRCEANGIPIDHHAVPRHIWKAMEAQEKGQTAKSRQGKVSTLHSDGCETSDDES
ncbi:hypothetical protein FPV67DRAFT_1561917 [Lyophyllum atratum]|nr:hypothetical protein FPV67DRAFT_1561917 [Lyophyllum atratum]